MAREEYNTAVLLLDNELEWTTLRLRKGEQEQVDQQRVTLEGDASDEVSRSAQIKSAMGGIKGTLTAVLPTDKVLLRVVDLPSTDAEELAGMVELQVDKFSPFPVEHMAVSYEVLRVQGEDSRVLIAACKRDLVESLGDLFEAVGRRPDRIDVAAAGWWHHVQALEGQQAEGRHGMLLLDASGSELVIAQNDVPLLVRSLGMQADASNEEFYRELAEEAGYTLTSLESEWGLHAALDLTVWHHGAAPQLLIDLLQQESGVAVLARSLDDMPPLSSGIAARSVLAHDDEQPMLDLSLDEWKAEATSRKGQRKLLVLVASLLAIWLVGMVAVFAVSRLGRSQVERLRSEVASLEEPAEDVMVLRRRVNSMEQYADRTHSALEILREVAEMLPDGVELTSFSYRKADQVNIRGESPRVEPIYDFLEELERSPLFIEARSEGITQAPGGRRNPDFRLTARLPGDEEGQQ